VLAAGLSAVRAAERLEVDLHPRIEATARRQYLLGEHELAAFAALREVEIRVRELSGASTSVIGVALMREAFRPTPRDPKDTQSTGPLTDADADRGEQVATMELFAGAIGMLKNPTSHRQVNYDDVTEAAEVVLLADLLHRVLDRVEVRLAAAT